ncbi:MAG: hypothetical protein M3P44_01460 [Actinomycetota bacterium]|nr:hypothetical protein [Actinomycetota bacterium]
MTTDRTSVDRAREQLARRDANAEDTPTAPPAPPREEIDEQERAVRDERGRTGRD